MEISNSDKTVILLNALNFNVDEINRKEQEQQKLFEWSTGLLLAAFAAVVALAGNTTPLAYPIPVKILATTLIAVPSCLFIFRIAARTKDIVGNAKAVESIEEALHLFEDGYYGTHSPFPQEWQGKLADTIRKDKMPSYYALISGLMTACVVTAIWLVL